jgi:beta-lactamase regulating signal transducer with metallopeptidase domain
MTGIGSADQFISVSGEVIRWLFTWSLQTFLLLGLVWAWLKLDRSRSATTRHRVWLIAVLAVAALPLFGALSQRLRLPAPVVVFQFGEIVPPVPVGEFRAARPAFSWSSILWPALFIFWAAGVTISLYRLGGSLWRLYRVQSRARIASLKDLGCSYSDLLRSDPGVTVALSEEVRSPGLAGLFRPVILLPADIVSWTSPEERVSIFRHEFAHIKRRDHITSRMQSAVTALLFFHPVLRYADSQLSLEREIACDDLVLDLGAEPSVYAEVILKAAERSFLTDVVHQAASFNARKTLERRIDMILNPDRPRRPKRQWPFLLAPAILIGAVVWMVVPAARSQSRALAQGIQSASKGGAFGSQSQSLPVVNRSTVIISTVERGTMLIQVRGLGVLVAGDDGRLKARIQIAAVQSKGVQVGQTASVDTRNEVLPGRVISVGSDDTGGVISIDVAIEKELPRSATAGLNVDGTIEISHFEDVLYTQRPARGQADAATSLFKIDADGETATRVPVRFGRSSVTAIEIAEGLTVGDRVIISDMSSYAGVNRVRLN